MHGIATLGAEVTNVSTHCFWLLLGEEKFAVPFSDLPWSKKATIEQLADVKGRTEDHLHWPQLGTDLSIESIRKPGSFPLFSRGTVYRFAHPDPQRQVAWFWPEAHGTFF